MSALDKLNYAPSARNAGDWQDAMLRNLVALDGVCREHGISYSLVFGGLLGAIRHRGFIPWDNDVDVAMSETEYLKLVDLAQRGLLPEGYALVDRNSEDDYPLLFGRFVDTRTSCPLSTSSFNGGMHGSFVDVFILFPLPDDARKQEQAVTKFLVWEQLACWAKRRSKYRTQEFVDDWCAIKDYEAQHGHAAALERAEAEFRALIPEFGASEWCLHGSGGKYNGFPRFRVEWFKEPRYVPFENVQLAVPNGAREFLEQFYGSGWREFPSGERFTPYAGACLSVPGSVVTTDYMRFIDQDKAVEDMTECTELQVRETVLLRKHDVPSIQARAHLSARRLNGELAGLPCVEQFSGAGLRDATLQEARDALDELSDVFDLLRNKDVVNWHVGLPFDAKLFAASLGAYFVAGRDYWTVRKLLAAHRAYLLDEGRCHDALERLSMLLDTCSALYTAIDDLDEETIRKSSAKLQEECPACVHAKVAQAWSQRGDADAVLAFIDGLDESYASEDYLRLLRAFALAESGRAAEGKQALQTVAKETTNGMLQLAIVDYCRDQGIGGVSVKAVSPPADQRQKGSKLPGLRSFGTYAAAKAYLHYGLRAAKGYEAELEETRNRIAELKDDIEVYRTWRRLTSERFYVWERMYPRADLVRAASVEGDPVELMRYMRAYVEATYRMYDGSDLGLFVTEELLDAAKPVFLKERGQEFFDDLISKIPPEHRFDFTDWLRGQDVKHPYFAEGWTPKKAGAK